LSDKDTQKLSLDKKEEEKKKKKRERKKAQRPQISFEPTTSPKASRFRPRHIPKYLGTHHNLNRPRKPGFPSRKETKLN